MRHLFQLAGVLALLTNSAFANYYGFTCTSSNSAFCPDIAEQFQVYVTAVGSTAVDFKFQNVGTISSSITDIYFGSLADPAPASLFSGLAIQQESAGVDFGVGASPNSPPGTAFTVQQSADSEPSVQPNGINNSAAGTEFLTLRLTLVTANTFNSVIAALDNQTLRIALHAQGLPEGESDWFINTPNPPERLIPEPSTYGAILASSIGALAILRRRRQASKA